MDEQQRIDNNRHSIISWERIFEWMMHFGYITFKSNKQAKETQKEFSQVGIKTRIESVYGRKFILTLVE